MERVAKRFLLHSKRETEEVKESDFDELKQDVQMVRAEMLNDMRIAKENLLRYTTLLHKGLSVLGECFFKNEPDSGIVSKFRKFRSFETNLQSEVNEILGPITPSKQ